MSTTLFALLLFGCADDGSVCQQLSPQPQYYDSQALCEADIDLALDSEISLRAEHPSVVAKCLPARDVAAIERGPVDLRESRFAPIALFSR